MLAVGGGEDPRQSLSELAKLGARLIIQRAVEDEFDAWFGRARYERRPDYQRGLRNYGDGLRNGYRPRRVQTAEGEHRHDLDAARAFVRGFQSTSAAVASLGNGKAARTVEGLRETLAAHYSDERGVVLDSRSWLITARRRR